MALPSLPYPRLQLLVGVELKAEATKPEPALSKQLTLSAVPSLDKRRQAFDIPF